MLISKFIEEIEKSWKQGWSFSLHSQEDNERKKWNGSKERREAPFSIFSVWGLKQRRATGHETWQGISFRKWLELFMLPLLPAKNLSLSHSISHTLSSSHYEGLKVCLSLYVWKAYLHFTPTPVFLSLSHTLFLTHAHTYAHTISLSLNILCHCSRPGHLFSLPFQLVPNLFG